MSHRSALILFISLVLFMTGCSGLLDNADSLNARLLSASDLMQTESDIDSIVSQIEDRHSVRVCYRKRPVFTWWTYKYRLAPKSDYAAVLEYLKILQKELGKYPEAFLRKAGVRYIVVCKKLSSWGFSAGGFPDPRRQTVYYDYNYSYADDSFSPYPKSTIHHELYHMIQAKFNRSMSYKDPVWAKLNDKEFTYGKGGRSFKYCDFHERPFHPRPGLVSAYATSALEEDKAEVYAALFVEEINAYLYDWIRRDEVLREKVDCMKDFLLQCCDEMNTSFWENLYTGEYSALGGIADSSYETRDSRYSVAVSENGVVELIAITQDSDHNPKWWRPNGEILDEAPFKVNRPKTSSDDKLKKYKFFVRFKVDESSHRFSFWDIPGAEVHPGYEFCVDDDGRSFFDIEVTTFSLSDDKETAQLRLGVVADDWTTKATYDPRTKSTNCPRGGVSFSEPCMQDGELKIEVSPIFANSGEMAEIVVATDLSGRDNHPGSWKISVDRDERKVYPSFSDLRLDQVKEFSLRTCPFTCVSFENISLRPGQITDVQVGLEKNRDKGIGCENSNTLRHDEACSQD